MRWFTANTLHGATRNPWDAFRTPGGSSGGAAAATAAGIGAVGHGNDIAGSVRYPAYCCGLVGLRVSYGRVPSYNFSAPAARPISSQLMAVQGPLTRRVRDARLALAAMAGTDPYDPRCVDMPLEGPTLRRPIRVALVTNPAGRGGVAPAVAESIRKAGGWLADAGYVVDDVDPPELGGCDDLGGRHERGAGAGGAAIRRRRHQAGPRRLAGPPSRAGRAPRARRPHPARPLAAAVGGLPDRAAARRHAGLERARVPGGRGPGRRRDHAAAHGRPDHAARGSGAGPALGVGAHRRRRRPADGCPDHRGSLPRGPLSRRGRGHRGPRPDAHPHRPPLSRPPIKAHLLRWRPRPGRST